MFNHLKRNRFKLQVMRNSVGRKQVYFDKICSKLTFNLILIDFKAWIMLSTSWFVFSYQSSLLIDLFVSKMRDQCLNLYKDSLWSAQNPESVLDEDQLKLLWHRTYGFKNDYTRTRTQKNWDKAKLRIWVRFILSRI